MYPRINLCFMCLNNSSNINVTDIIAKEIENLMPEIVIFKMNIPLRICSVCEKNVLLFSEFKQASLVNIIQLQASITKALSSKDKPNDMTQIISRQNTIQISIKEDILKINNRTSNLVREKEDETCVVNNIVNYNHDNENTASQPNCEIKKEEDESAEQNNPEFFINHVPKIENKNSEINNTDYVNPEVNIKKDEDVRQEIPCGNTEEISVKDDILNENPNNRKYYDDLVRKIENDSSETNNIVKHNVMLDCTDHTNNEVNIKKEEDAAQEIECENIEKKSIIDGIIYEMKNENCNIINNINYCDDDEMSIDHNYHLTMMSQCGNGSMEIFIKEENPKFFIGVEQDIKNENCNSSNTTNCNNATNNTDYSNHKTTITDEDTELKINCQNVEEISIKNDILEENPNDLIYVVVEEMYEDCKIDDNVIYINDDETSNSSTQYSEDDTTQYLNTPDTHIVEENKEKRNKNVESQIHNQTLEELLISKNILKENSIHAVSTSKVQSGKSSKTQTFDISIIQFDKEKNNKKEKILASEKHPTLDDMVIEDVPEENPAHKFSNDLIRDIRNEDGKTKKNINCSDVNVVHTTCEIHETCVKKAQSDKVSTTQAFDIIQLDIENKNKKDKNLASEIRDLTLDEIILVDDIPEQIPVNDNVNSTDHNTPKLITKKVRRRRKNKGKKKKKKLASKVHDLTLEEIIIAEDTVEVSDDQISEIIAIDENVEDGNGHIRNNEHHNTNISNVNVSNTNCNLANKSKRKAVMNVCEVCLKKFTTSNALALHMKNHANYFPCSKCKYWFTNKVELKAHTENMHSVFLCTVCNKLFTNKVDFNSHKEIHTREKELQCSICHKMFTYECVLQAHMRKHYENKEYPCYICNKMYTNNVDLKQHLKTHSKIVRCSICNKLLRSIDEVNSHKKEHSKIYRCSTCNKVLRSKDEVISHKKEHLKKIGFRCPICNRTFKFSITLKLHMKTHPGKFICHICNRAFRYKSGLARHIKNHVGN